MTLPNEPAPMAASVGAEPASQMKALSALSPAAGAADVTDAEPLKAKAPLVWARPSTTAQAAGATASASSSTPEPQCSSEPAHIYGASGAVPYRIALRAAAETWLDVKDGETSIFRRLMQPGDEYRVPEKPSLIMRIGNAKGIEVLVAPPEATASASADMLS